MKIHIQPRRRTLRYNLVAYIIIVLFFLQHSEKVDYWGLKKSILYTLFQAVKAITGGVTILKGQLIKGGGALASTIGKVISSKGDVVSNFGKKIVSSAALSEKKPACKYFSSLSYLFLI